jgi:outer membrane receptor for ferrienterochelin and colicin
LIGLFLCSLPTRSSAQVTTSTMRGTVKSADDGVPMAEVEVTLVDESTGSVKTAATGADGSFVFNNLQVGGPYHVTATVSGFKSAEEKDIFLTANKTRDVALGLHLQEEVIEVAGAAVTRTTSNRTVVTAAEIDELPSVGRDPRDVVRRNPEVSVEGRDRTLSIGGQNTRYNSITVDGIRQDDDFGLNTSGYPTRRSPIALSAIEELIVESSPFDVHYGKFLGGNVNIVTKSGTNEVKGTLVGTYSSDSLLGNRSRDNRVNVDYSEVRYGATVGGPIIKDKVHFLLSAEGLNASTPVSVGAAGSGAANITSKVSQDALAMVQQASKNVYGFDAGTPAQSLNEGDLKLFGKLDWQIDKQNRATVSYQRTGGNSIQAASASDTTLPLTSDWYDARDTLNTFSARVFSDWSDQLSTDVEVNAKLVTSLVPPLGGNGFMQATINTQATAMDPTTNGRIIIGPDEFRHANTLDNDVIHGKAEANYLLAGHLVTGGFEYELLRINNLFVPASNGVAQYGSLEDFMNKNPSSLRYSNAVTLNPADGAAKWNNATWTGYAQDQFKITPELTVQAGARLEMYTTGDRITRNQNFVNRYADTLGIENNATLDGRTILMPRLGVSYLPMDRLNVRAGLGLYSGGSPSVWVSNAYSNDGVRINSVTCPGALCNAALIKGFDGRNIPQGLKDLVQAGNGNVDLIDPNFDIPSAWKIGTGVDYSLDIPALDDLGKNLELKANYTFTKVRHGINWVDLRRNLASLPNNTPIGTTPDGRDLYPANFNAARGYDMMLTNDDHGYGHVASVQVQKGFPFGLFVSGSYAYQDVREINPGTSSRSVSNYGLTAIGDPNDPTDAISNYERKHRLTAAIEYSHPIVSYFTDASPWKDMKTAIGMFVESRSGQPFSWSFGATENVVAGRTDAFGTKLGRIFGEDTTFSTRNRELFYVPTEAETCTGTPGVAPPPGCNVVLSDGTAMGANAPTKAITIQDFNAFLAKTGLDKYRGQIVPRNAFHSPWFNRFDMRIAQDLPNPLTGHRARFVVDIENLGNLLDHNWGRAQAVPFPYIAPAVDLDYDRVNNKYNYSNIKSTNPTTVDILQSVWRVSLGLMYDF